MKYGQWTLILISINIIISFFVFTSTDSNQNIVFETFGYSAEHRSLYGLITYAFLHLNLEHLFNNMLFLLIYGVLLEQTLGGAKLLKLYFFCAIIGILVYSFINVNGKVCIGASVAISGIMGAYCSDKNRNFILTVLACIIISCDAYLFLQNVQDSVAHLAHILGFIFGFLYHKIILNKMRYDVI